MINDSRPNYYDVPEYSESSNGKLFNPPENTHGSGERFDSDLDLVTEHEVVPDFVERLSIRYPISYNDTGDEDSKFHVLGGNKIKLIKIIDLLLSFIPSALSLGQINNTYSAIFKIKAGDSNVNCAINHEAGNNINLQRAYLASNYLDITNCMEITTSTTYRTIFTVTTTIPFKYDDEIIMIYKK